MASITSSLADLADLAHPSTTPLARARVCPTHSPSSNMSSPLMDRTNTGHSRSTFAASTAGSTTWLPEMHSTPPMPTFQKPDTNGPSPMQRTPTTSDITPTRPSVPRRPATSESSFLTNLPCHVSFRPRTPITTVRLIDRVGETPPLPPNWTGQHDRAICILDARNYTHTGIVAKIRRAFPNIRGTLTPAMIDKRLRQLDQNVYVDYWALGLSRSERQRTVGALSPPGPSSSDASRVDSSSSSTAFTADAHRDGHLRYNSGETRAGFPPLHPSASRPQDSPNNHL